MKKISFPIRMSPELHKKVKLLTLLKGISLQQYIINLIEDDLEDETEGVMQELMKELKRSEKENEQ